MRHPAYLEVGPAGWAFGYVFALPGVRVHARTADAALAALPAALADEFAYLARHGRPWPHAAGPAEIVEAERVAVSADVAHGMSNALFRYELRPTTDADVALALDRLELGRRDLLDAVAALRTAHGDAWGAQRPDGGAGDGATVRPGAAELARAAADEEWWLLSRLGTRPAAQLPEDPLERLAAARALTIERLHGLLPGDRERHAVLGGEPWTTRKVLRRLVCHERARAAEFAALAAAGPAAAHSPRGTPA